MIARLAHLRKYPSVFRHLTGVTVAVFDDLTAVVAPAVEAVHRKTLDRPDRERAIGGGDRFDLSIPDQLLLTVIWLRQYPTNEILGFLLGVSDSTASRVVARCVPATGTQWGDVPAELGCSGRTAHRRLRAWEELGIRDRPHADLLRLLRAADELDPDVAIMDGVIVRAFGGGEATGPSSVDRHRPGTKHTLLVDRRGVPLAIRAAGANASDHTRIIPLVLDFPAVGGKPGRPKERSDALYADRGYDGEATRWILGGWASSRTSPSGGRPTGAGWGRSGGWSGGPSGGSRGSAGCGSGMIDWGHTGCLHHPRGGRQLLQHPGQRHLLGEQVLAEVLSSTGADPRGRPRVGWGSSRPLGPRPRTAAMTLPPEARDVVLAFFPAFTTPTYHRFTTLLVAAILTTGRRTIASLLRTVRHLAPGHPTACRRVLSRAPWSGVRLGCALARFLLDHVVPDGPVMLVGDDTVDGHPGRTVDGKARHRAPVRSSHAFTAWRYGHEWAVLAVLVRFPFAARRWALPVPVNLYRPPELDRAEGRPHKAPARLMCRLLRLPLIRFPGRAFVFAGDSSYGTHEVARFCHRHRGRLTPVSKLCPDAHPFAPPPAYAGKGRPRVRGTGCRSPARRRPPPTGGG